MKEEILQDYDQLKQKITHETDIKLIEAITKMHDAKDNRSLWENPILPIIFSALLGTAGIIAGKIYDTNQINKNRSKELERDLIVKAIETTNPETSRGNLKLLANAKLISDPALIIGIENLMKDSSYNFQTLETQKTFNLISTSLDGIKQSQHGLDTMLRGLIARNNELQQKSKEAEVSNKKLAASVEVFQHEIEQLKLKPELSNNSQITQLNKTSEALKLELQKQASTIYQQQQQQKLQHNGLNKIQQQQQQKQHDK